MATDRSRRMFNTPKYGSVNHVPDYNDRQRYVCLTLMHRGQRLADQPFAAAYPGLLTQGIDDPRRYVYRVIAADCIRGAEFLLCRPEVDQIAVAILGDDLALIAAARRPQFALVQAAGLMFYRMTGSRWAHQWLSARGSQRVPARPPREGGMCRPDRRLLRSALSRDRVTATTLFPVGSDGSTSGKDWLKPLTDAIAGPVEYYELTNQGGTDHDCLMPGPQASSVLIQ